MASLSASTSHTGSTAPSSGAATPTPKSKLDSLPREDLIKFVKKQVANFQSVKKRADTLEQQLADRPNHEQFSKQQDEIESLRAERTACQSDLDAERAKVATTLDAHDALQQQLLDQQRSFDAERLDLKRKHEQLQSDNAALAENMCSERIRLETKIADLEKTTVAEEMSANERLELQKMLEEVGDELETTRKDLNAANVEKTRIYTELQSEIGGLRSELDAAFAKSTALQCELDTTKTALEETTQRLHIDSEKLMAKLSASDSLQLQLTTQKELLLQELTEKDVEVEKLKQQLSHTFDTLDTKTEALTGIQSECQLLRSLLNDKRQSSPSPPSDSNGDPNRHLLLLQIQPSTVADVSDADQTADGVDSTDNEPTNEDDQLSQEIEAVQTLRERLLTTESENERLKIEVTEAEQLKARLISSHLIPLEHKSTQCHCASPPPTLLLMSDAVNAVTPITVHATKKRQNEEAEGASNDSDVVVKVDACDNDIARTEESKQADGLMEKLEKDAQQAKRHRDQLLKANHSLAVEVAELKKRQAVFVQAKVEKESLEMKLSHTGSQLKTVEQQVEHLTLENERFKKLLQRGKEDNKVLEKTVENANEEVVQVRREHSEAQWKIDELHIELEGLRQQLSSAYQNADPFSDTADSVKAPETTSVDCQTETETTITSNVIQSEHNVATNAGLGVDQLEVLTDKLTLTDATLSEKELEIDALKESLRDQKSLIDNVTTQLEQTRKELDAAKLETHNLQHNLQSMKMDVSDNSVLNLEMADYERSLKKLQEDLVQSEALLDSKANENNLMRKEIDGIKSQKARTEANLAKLKAAFVKQRQELTEAKNQAVAFETEAEELKAKQRTAIEEIETLKMELALSVSNGQTRMQQLEMAAGRFQKQSATLLSERDTLKTELTAVKNDFETYKVRVHSVLKQQQAKSTVESSFSEEKDHLSQTVTDLQQKLAEISLSYGAVQEELSSTQEDCDRITARLTEAQKSAESVRMMLHRQLDDQKTAYEGMLAKERDSVTKLTAVAHETEMEHQMALSALESDHNNTVESLRDRIAALESELESSAQRQRSSVTVTGDEANGTNASTSHHYHHNQTAIVPPFSERKPAEGMESEESARLPVLHLPSPTQFKAPRPPFDHSDVYAAPLEDLLASSDQISVDSFSVPQSPVLGMEIQTRLEKALKRIQHVNELLHESEATNARLTEQTKLLKAEIRRLENNREREAHLANCEYLKNIILKFLSPQVSTERQRLIPVLTTMLKLNNDEVVMLQRISKDENEDGDSQSGSTKWSGYLPRWSGLT